MLLDATVKMYFNNHMITSVNIPSASIEEVATLDKLRLLINNNHDNPSRAEMELELKVSQG